MKRLRFKPLPDAGFGVRAWGVKDGHHSYIYSFTPDWGWGASRQDKLTRTTVHAEGRPFASEQEALAAIEILRRQVNN